MRQLITRILRPRAGHSALPTAKLSIGHVVWARGSCSHRFQPNVNRSYRTTAVTKFSCRIDAAGCIFDTRLAKQIDGTFPKGRSARVPFNPAFSPDMADDEDTPPPLNELTDQVQALKLASGSHQSSLPGSELPVACTTTISAKSSVSSTQKAGFKKGFLSCPTAAKSKAKTDRQDTTQPQETTPVIPHLKAKKNIEPSIPEGFRIQPDEQQKKYEAYKSQLVQALQPTPDMIMKIQGDGELLSGFDDPEVMAAVADVAKNPQNMRKYANNPKVVKFYTAMGQVMGDKLQAAGQAPVAGPQRLQ